MLTTMNLIDYAELEERLFDADLVLLDVLPRKVYERGHLPNARCLPVAEIPKRAGNLIGEGDEVIIYCVNEN